MKRALAFLGACMLLLAVTVAGQAQTSTSGYPARSIRVVVPYPAGGPTDLIARLVAQKLSDSLGQRFYIENVAGASGARAAAMVAAAPGDGYTLLAATNDLAIVPVISKNVQYDPVKNFVPIGLVSSSPSVVLVHPSVPAKTMAEFVALARSEPAKYSFASLSLGHNLLNSERLFKLGLKLEITRVPFTGAAPILTSTVAGHTPVAYIGLPSAVPFIKDGRLRALAVAGSKRSPIVPDVPTLSEGGFQDQVSELVIGLVAPAGTPDPIVDLLSKEVVKIVALPEIQERLASFGFAAVGSTPAEFAAQIRDDTERYQKLVREEGIKVE
jgi:tripartite-type tricarboxylate transporter receptor subunit TctC